MWAFRRLGKTVNDFFISCHLFPDGELWIGRNLVFVGNVLPPVVVFDKLAAVGKKKTAFDKAAIFIDPHIPAIRLIVKIIPQVFGNVDHFHVLRINAAQGFIIGHADIEIVTIQIFRKVYEVARAGSMLAAGNNCLKLLQIAFIQLGKQTGQMVEFVNTFIFPQAGVKLRQVAVIIGNKNLLIADIINADLF